MLKRRSHTILVTTLALVATGLSIPLALYVPSDSILDKLESSSLQERIEAVQWIVENRADEGLAALVRQLLSTSDPEWSAEIRKGLIEYGPDASIFLLGVDDKDWNDPEKSATISAFLGYLDISYLLWVKRALTADDKTVRLRALILVRDTLRAEESLPLIGNLLDDPDEQVRKVAEASYQRVHSRRP